MYQFSKRLETKRTTSYSVLDTKTHKEYIAIVGHDSGKIEILSTEYYQQGKEISRRLDTTGSLGKKIQAAFDSQ